MDVTTLVLGLRANACGVWECEPGAVAATVVARVCEHSGAGRVALSGADALLVEFGVEDALRAAGCELLLAGDPAWSADLARVAVGVTGAACAVAEPSSLALASSAGVPRATSLVPPVHVCVVHARTLFPTFADAVADLATRALPSAVTWIGGPSRTGDLEMITTLGVHGPRVVDVVLVR
jgi:L-lactate dehydrogenase complex protein LldG